MVEKNTMIFVGGIHGVGKSYFCEIVKNKLGIKSYSASQLITSRRNRGFAADKLVPDIDDNQLLLAAAVDELRRVEREFILDGHFCLLNAEGIISRIPLDTFISLTPGMIILLTEKPEVIANRRLWRDHVQQNVSDIKDFQNAERKYAEEVAAQLGIPLEISNGDSDLERILGCIQKGGL